MSVARVGSPVDGGSFAGVSSKSFSVTCTGGADHMLVVFVGYYDGSTNTTASVTYNGVSMTSLAKKSGTTVTKNQIEAFGLLNPPAGSHTVAITFGASGQYGGCGAQEYESVDTSTPVDGVASAEGANSIGGNSLGVTSATGSYAAFGSINTYSAGSFACDQGAIFTDSAVGGTIWAAARDAAGASTVTFTSTWNVTGGGGWSQIGFSVREGGGSPDVTVSATGVSATTSGGTASPATDKAITGQSATASAGTASPGLAKALTGSAATASGGSVSPGVVIALSGVAATSAVGTVSPSGTVSVELTGVSATASAGSVAPDATIPVGGQEATTSAGTVSPSTGVTVELTGVEATTGAGSVAPGAAVGLSGQEATSDVGAVSVASPDVTVALSGVSAVAAAGELAASGGDVVADAPQETAYATPKRKREYRYDYSPAPVVESPIAQALAKAIEVKAEKSGVDRAEIEKTLRRVADLGAQQEAVTRQIEAEAREIEQARLVAEMQRLQDAEDAEVAEVLAMLL